MTGLAGYREHEHTADWELEVWAPNLPGLFEQAARGMYAVSGTRLQASPRQERRLSLTDLDQESLLVAFLEELLYLGEMEGLGFDSFDLLVTPSVVDARLGGAPLLSRDKEIKAVTFHRLLISQEAGKLSVRIVFDV